MSAFQPPPNGWEVVSPDDPRLDCLPERPLFLTPKLKWKLSLNYSIGECVGDICRAKFIYALPIQVEAVPPASADPKGDAGKTKAPMELLPPFSLMETAWVHGLGAEKYGRYNWRKGDVNASIYVSAIMRHLMAWQSGEDNDPESGRSHLAHIAAGCNILMDAQKHGRLIDDRP